MSSAFIDNSYTYDQAISIKSKMLEQIEWTSYSIQKNFQQMDFENADAKSEMLEHVIMLLTYCEELRLLVEEETSFK